MRFALVIAFARALLAVVFSIAFIAIPAQLMPGTELEPARSLAVLFVSRNLVFAVALAIVAARREARALGWLLLADVALQVFDAAHAHDATSAMPVIIGLLEAIAARQALRLRSGQALSRSFKPSAA